MLEESEVKTFLDHPTVDSEMKPRLYKFAKNIIGLTLWPENPDSVLCSRLVDEMSTEQLLDFSNKVQSLVNDVKGSVIFYKRREMANRYFSENELVTYRMISCHFDQFLIYLKFEGDHKVALELERSVRKELTIDPSNIDWLYAWMVWSMCFGRNWSFLWLRKGGRIDSPIPHLVSLIDKLGKFAPEIKTAQGSLLQLDNHNRLDVSSIYPNAGCGLSLTCLILEDCPRESPLWLEINNNLCPILKDGPLITIISDN